MIVMIDHLSSPFYHLLNALQYKRNVVQTVCKSNNPLQPVACTGSVIHPAYRAPVRANKYTGYNCAKCIYTGTAPLLQSCTYNVPTMYLQCKAQYSQVYSYLGRQKNQYAIHNQRELGSTLHLKIYNTPMNKVK